MKENTTENTIYGALLKVQQSVSLEIKANAINPRFSKDGKKTYADLHAIMEVLTPVLGTNGILLMQSMSSDCIETTLYHIPSGQSIIKEHKIDMSNLDIQQVGSYITYMRRYTICALFGIAIDKDDDDGNIASDKLTIKKKLTDKKTLTKEEFESPLFTSTLDKYLKDDIIPEEILDKIKVKYILTANQEATILNLK